ncbi:Uu.00g141270.m01.CDS01 [Anthostomella pinea]|uniref:Uu.00g141270.m01.CDS01 n=1 Tax=Anthostomella pinea TaxID=933095 RepID=A0AAI8VQ71_9PEZI|nr:Uu.00g141270.m01.CDS01 [Anthostomella pinea]
MASSHGSETPPSPVNDDDAEQEFNWAAVIPPPSAQHAVSEALTATLLDVIPSIAQNAVMASFEATSLWASQDVVRPILHASLQAALTTAVGEHVRLALERSAPAFAAALAPSQGRPQQTGEQPSNEVARTPAARDCVCPECDKQMSRGSWFDHIRQCHIGPRCLWRGCAAQHEDMDDGVLRRHLRRHRTEQLAAHPPQEDDGRHYCGWPTCTKSYGSKDRAERHLFEHQVTIRRDGDPALNAKYNANEEAKGLVKGDGVTLGEQEGEDDNES